MLEKLYETIPFKIFDGEKIKILIGRLEDMKSKMKNYREGDFAKYKSTMYDMVCEIIKSKTTKY